MPLPDTEFDRALREELDRRVAEISAYPDGAFGLIPMGELLLCALVSVVLPLALVFFFR